MSLVNINDVRKQFGPLEVLKGINLEIAKSEVIALIGKSGSGKTTLLRCINGLEEINSGSIEACGIKLSRGATDLRELRLRVGMIFQQFNLFPHLSVGRNVMLAQTVVKNIPEDEARRTACEMLEKVGLAEKFDFYPDQLSGGQQQRVAIARALAMKPDVLLCDEITSALDPELVGEVLSVVRALASEGMTLIMVTHEMAFAREVCDRVVFMHQGRIHEVGKPEEIFSSPRTTEMATFIGSLAPSPTKQ
ncbi:ABC-type polar amino acid transport system, ATPase component [Rhizobium leguminosarum bv. trifolii WSM597]|uniref:ABC-type polar amino acid transport system, ATPase component n=1 Tax=Rhizobium leguminosarum bv. trifolii WSM597 TaxID=754764 RepID=I9NJX0_RHILT|nr:amino acid ABC transporter ATP-binding protein [Rhizobium leguminosarum]EJB07037.1 ABC-type polar amino acid transport system, ATPase component [Rhizobium leguminosarum bv. trifolii WSM597]